MSAMRAINDRSTRMIAVHSRTGLADCHPGIPNSATLPRELVRAVAQIIAMMPARIGSGRVSQNSTMIASSSQLVHPVVHPDSVNAGNALLSRPVCGSEHRFANVASRTSSTELASEQPPRLQIGSSCHLPIAGFIIVYPATIGPNLYAHVHMLDMVARRNWHCHG